MKMLTFILASALPLLAVAASNPDESFYKKAAEAGNSEVAAGQLAQEKGSSSAVRDFGAMMVRDHSEANTKLEQLASSKNIKLPKGAGAMNDVKEKELKLKSGASFDKAYIEAQIKGHEAVSQLLQKEIASGQDADAQAFARSILPTVKEHLQKIRQIAAQTNPQ